MSAKKLTSRQLAFVEAYISNGGVGGKAAREAGYSLKASRGAAYDLLRLPHIHALVNAGLAEKRAKAAMSAKELREELGVIGFNRSLDPGDRTRALATIARIDGLFAPDTVVNVNLSPVEIARRLNAHAVVPPTPPKYKEQG